MKNAILALFASSLFLFACGDSKGDSCFNEDDCGGSLICAQYVICSGVSDCMGVCSDPCDTTEDCSGNEACMSEPGAGRGFCRFDALAD